MRTYENSKENCIVDDGPSSGIYLVRQCFEVLTVTSPRQVHWSVVPVAAASLPPVLDSRLYPSSICKDS